jgi:hypothetical protein
VIKAVVADQKMTGLWASRVKAGGIKQTAWRLTYEACRVELKTVGDCAAAAQFVHRLANLAVPGMI